MTIDIEIDQAIKAQIPQFKIGAITYHDIAVSASPQMFQGHFQLYQEEMMLSLEEKNVADIGGIQEWRQVFKTLGTDPSRYRPSHEALYRRLKKRDQLPMIHSAADVNNFFSLQFEIPLGIYDADKLDGDIAIRMGTDEDMYETLNGRTTSMTGKILSADTQAPFGSPIIDSKRTMTTETTTNALQIIYLKPSMSEKEAQDMLASIADMFIQINGGKSEQHIIT
ncbi:B3/B4 domain-containing protein [Tuberibacillus sp. Marseille-P3662]|uniref:B3/B4 domain-containing protein n=1 Tax=Tuberibacillus sp. Marseille-P3662 TaxID=1965358 RepID=UPI0034E84930